MNFGNRNSQRSFTDQALTFLTYGLGIGIAVLCVLPFLYMLSVVFRPSDQLWTVQLIPSSLTLTTLETSFGRVGDLPRNSVLISSGTMLVSPDHRHPQRLRSGGWTSRKSTMFYLVLLIIMFPSSCLSSQLRRAGSLWGCTTPFPACGSRTRSSSPRSPSGCSGTTSLSSPQPGGVGAHLRLHAVQRVPSCHPAAASCPRSSPSRSCRSWLRGTTSSWAAC